MGTKSGIELIAAERQRQIEKEGWSEEHDYNHEADELAIAGACYALAPTYRPGIAHGLETPKKWPWEGEWWKPSPDNRIKELVKAGALIAAEIDKLQSDKL